MKKLCSDIARNLHVNESDSHSTKKNKKDIELEI